MEKWTTLSTLEGVRRIMAEAQTSLEAGRMDPAEFGYAMIECVTEAGQAMDDLTKELEKTMLSRGQMFWGGIVCGCALACLVIGAIRLLT